MDDARKFLRYVTPGLVFIIEVFIYLFIVNTSFTIELFNTLSKNQGWLTLFVMSGGIGFLFSIIHHRFYWWIWGYLKFLCCDHRNMIKNSIKHKYLKLILQDCLNEISPDNISRVGAWRIVANIWNTRKVTSKRIEGVNWTMDNLSDIMHGAGTIFIGSFSLLLVCVLYILIHINLPDKVLNVNSWSLYSLIFSINPQSITLSQIKLTLIIPLIFIVLHFFNYKCAVKNAQSVADMILYQELKIEHSRKKEHEEPIEVIIKTNSDTILHQELRTDRLEKKETKESKEPVEVIITSRELKLRLRVGNSLQKLINKI